MTSGQSLKELGTIAFGDHFIFRNIGIGMGYFNESGNLCFDNKGTFINISHWFFFVPNEFKVQCLNRIQDLFEEISHSNTVLNKEVLMIFLGKLSNLIDEEFKNGNLTKDGWIINE